MIEMLEPDYVICLECETPTYLFEWSEGIVSAATCLVCGNEDPALFVTEEELEDMAASREEEGEEGGEE